MPDIFSSYSAFVFIILHAPCWKPIGGSSRIEQHLVLWSRLSSGFHRQFKRQSLFIQLAGRGRLPSLIIKRSALNDLNILLVVTPDWHTQRSISVGWLLSPQLWTHILTVKLYFVTPVLKRIETFIAIEMSTTKVHIFSFFGAYIPKMDFVALYELQLIL